jgi:hypothetical protein
MFGREGMIRQLKGAQPKLLKMAVEGDAEFKGLVEAFHYVNEERRKSGRGYFVTEYRHAPQFVDDAPK